MYVCIQGFIKKPAYIQYVAEITEWKEANQLALKIVQKYSPL